MDKKDKAKIFFGFIYCVIVIVVLTFATINNSIGNNRAEVALKNFTSLSDNID